MSERPTSNTESNSNSQTSVDVVDNWESVTEELQDAQIAERKKQIEQRQNEEEQLKIAPSTSSAEDDNINRDSLKSSFDPLNGKPIRLLRRPESSSTLKDKDENQKNTKVLTFEEREAAYQQARNRIFGSDSSTVAAASSGDSNSRDQSGSLSVCEAKTGSEVEGDNEVAAKPAAPVRNYLSDVQMVTSDSAPLSQNRRAGGIGKNNHMRQSLPLRPQQPYLGGGIAPGPLPYPFTTSGPPPIWTSAPPPPLLPLPSLHGVPMKNISGGGCISHRPPPSHQYGQPPGFATGYLSQPPPQGAYQGGWWISHPPPQPSAATAVRQQMPQVNYTTMNNPPPPYHTNVQAITNKVNVTSSLDEKPGVSGSGSANRKMTERRI